MTLHELAQVSIDSWVEAVASLDDRFHRLAVKETGVRAECPAYYEVWFDELCDKRNIRFTDRGTIIDFEKFKKSPYGIRIQFVTRRNAKEAMEVADKPDFLVVLPAGRLTCYKVRYWNEGQSRWEAFGVYEDAKCLSIGLLDLCK